MKRKNRDLIVILLFLMCMPGLVSVAKAQNFMIEVIDASNYRTIDNARVELKANETNLVFFTDPGGRVTDHIPIAAYSITITHRFYETETIDRFRVRPHELNSITVKMNRKPPEPDIHHGPDIGLDVVDASDDVHQGVITYQRPERRFFIDIGVHAVNYRAIQLSVGSNLFRDLFASLSITFSKQDYMSNFFVNPVREYDVLFFKTALGAGYNFTYPLNHQMGLFAVPSASVGIELANNKRGGFIENYVDDISYLMMVELKPELKIGMYYNRFGLYLGLDYSQWLSSPFDQNLRELYNGETEEAMNWGDDLFRKRKGVGFITGIVISI